MRKLDKLKLKGFYAMSEVDMKNVVGGYGSGSSTDPTGPVYCLCNGSVVQKPNYEACYNDCRK